MRQEWFSAAELAAACLPGMPAEKKNVILTARRRGWDAPDQEGRLWRVRQGRGAGVEYHYSALPLPALQSLVVRLGSADAATPVEKGVHAAAWDWWHRRPDRVKEKGAHALRALDAIEALLRAGTSKCTAIQLVCAEYGVKPSTVYRWESLIAGIDRAHWLAYLTPRHVGRLAEAECPDEAWEVLKALYLRPERPCFTSCYRHLADIGREKGWRLPSEDTLLRRIKRDVPHAVQVMARYGTDAVKKLYPAQERSRAMLRAMEAVNADGHKIDVFVRWPDGEIIRPMLIVFQDLYSGKLLSCRVDRSENLEAVRLAFGDVIEAFGVPSHCTLDNTRTFASKRLTGGMSNRFRWKVKADDPTGIMTKLGVQVHWSTPYSGQSKPIERAFRDLAENLAKHPKFAGAYVGNNPLAKPENYGSSAVTYDDFLAVVSESIAEHNARPKRRSVVCDGRQSFNDAFEASYSVDIIRQADGLERRLWMMAATDVQVQRDGLHFHGNRYHAPFLIGLDGRKVTVRFDPELLHEPLHVYDLAGAYLGSAECLEAVGFFDLAAASEHGRRRRAFIKAQRAMLKAERSMDVSEAAALMPRRTEAKPVEAKVVRPIFRSSDGLARKPVADADEELSAFDTALVTYARAARAARGDHLRVVEEDD